MKVLLVGATGATGKLVLESLLSEPLFQKVYVIGRRNLGIEHEKLIFFQVNFEQLDQFSFPEIQTLDQLYFCYGTTLKKAGGKEAFIHQEWELSQRILTLGIRFQVKRLLLISAMGASSQSAILYSKIKGRIEVFAQQIGYPEIVIFRPSLLLTPREELRVGELLAQKLVSPLQSLMHKHLPKYAPVTTVKLAMALISWGKKEKLESKVIVLENEKIL